MQTVRAVEGLQGGGEVVPQRGTQPQQLGLAVPDHRLMRPRHYLDALGERGVPGDRAQLMGIGAHHIRQHMRIPGIAFRPRSGQPLAIAGHLYRIDREHPIPRSDQRRHPQPPIGFDPDQHLPSPGLIIRVGELADQGMQPGQPVDAFREPGPAQPGTGPVLHLHIMMIFSPIVPDEQHTASTSHTTHTHPARPHRPDHTGPTTPARPHRPGPACG